MNRHRSNLRGHPNNNDAPCKENQRRSTRSSRWGLWHKSGRKNKAKKRTIQDITNKLLDAHKTEQRLQKQVVDKDKLIVKVNSMYTSCRKQMVKQRKKAKSKQDEIQEKDQVGVHTCTCQHMLV